MSEEEYESNNVYYSPFWPLTTVLVGFILWLGVQIVLLVEQQNTANNQLAQLAPTVQKAQVAYSHLVALIQDLAQTSSKDPYAAQIMKEMENAGLLRPNPNTNGTAPAAAPASSSESTNASP
ncbi:MAG: hypothetical protein LV481_15070 [Methylacidiphilales bacterium]|nr:hypothetical protein [Candidatus Methylacidiphilales bacterium]